MNILNSQIKSKQNNSLSKVDGVLTQISENEKILSQQLFNIAQNLMPQYGEQWNVQSNVVLNRQALSRLLYYNHLYQKIVDIPGVICEFGVQWGATLSQLVNLRGIYEPYNHSRKIFGFDTFEGFSTVDDKDGGFSKVGDYATIKNYEEILDIILSIHEANSPLPHIQKYQLLKGNASETIDTWLTENPHAIVAMAIFDMDVYVPTKDVLEKIIPRLTKGSLLVFDELNCQHFPGETRALNDVLGLNNITLKRFPHQPYCAWSVFGE